MKPFLTTCFTLALAAGLMLAAPDQTGKKAEAPAQSKEAKQAVDPVCSMTVDTKTAEKSAYKGKTYYFCSREDKETFDKTPDKYVKSASNTKK